jgi:hypothetical protein
MRLVAEDVSRWKVVLRMSKREAHENVAYVNGGLAKGNSLPHNFENYDCACILRIRKHHLNGCHGGACVVVGLEWRNGIVVCGMKKVKL